MTDQPTTKPGDLVYEDTGANAPLVYFDIVGAYGTMNGSIEIELATRILVPEAGWLDRGQIHFLRPPSLHPERRRQPAQRAGVRLEDAGAAAGERGDCGGEAELIAR